MIAFLSSWKTWAGFVLPLGGIAAFLLLPTFAKAVGNFLSTSGGRLVAALAVIAWLTWMYLSWVETNAYERGADDLRQRIEEQDARAIDAARKARIPVAECYARGGEWIIEEGLCKLPAE